MIAKPPSVWHLLSPDFPPKLGGVGDHSALLAGELAERGHEVHVWTSSADAESHTPGISVHRLPDFLSTGRRLLDRGLQEFAAPRTLFVQYTPQLYGLTGLNLPFVNWLLRRRYRHHDDVRVNFHEVAFPWVPRPLKHNLIAATNRVMAAGLIQAANRIYLSTPAWEQPLVRLGARRDTMTWLPIMSNIPVVALSNPRPHNAPPVVGHFGTYGGFLAPLLQSSLKEIMQSTDSRIRLIGSGGDAFARDFSSAHPQWAGRLDAPGQQSAAAISAAIQTCDVMIQPYVDGLNARRGSALAALAHGAAVVTNVGANTESFWQTADPPPLALVPVEKVAAEAVALLTDDARRRKMSECARRFYNSTFSTQARMDCLLNGAPA